MDDNLKSQASIMLNLYRGLLHDCRLQHQVSTVETTRDMDVLVARTHAEGVGFLTKTLPLIAKSYDEALKTGQFLPLAEFGHNRRECYPRLFRWLHKLVFERDGRLKDDADVSAIQSVRQICYLFYKYQIAYGDRTVRLAIEDFVDTDQQIRPLTHDVETTATIHFAQEVIDEVFTHLTQADLQSEHLCPKNGPGAVAHGEKPWQRYAPKRFYTCLDELEPYGSLYYLSDRHMFDHWDSYFGLPCPEDHGVTALLAVPKDSRGPRLISKEPQEFMVYQQVMKNLLVPYLERHPLTGGQVNFTDQTINGKLALMASVDGSLATLDLSAASDRLSLELVEALFEGQPHLLKWLKGSRSEATQTPNGLVHLRKFAPMGSALTFPVQAICFYALLVGALVREGMPLRTAAKSVWVYGDDIILSTNFAPQAIETLHLVGLKVNTAKSCYSGHFRESCGVDAWKGIDITPVKLKKLWQHTPEPTTLQSWISSCDLLFRKGYWRLSDAMKRMIEDAAGFDLPVVSSESSLMGFRTWSRDHAVEANRSRAKWSCALQTRMYKGKRLRTKSSLKLHSGWERLLNFSWNTKQEEESSPLWGIPFSTGLFSERSCVSICSCVVAESSL